MTTFLCLLLAANAGHVRVPDKSALPDLRTNIVWVFFTDKGIYSDRDYEAALDALAERAPADVAARRQRESIGGFDFDDLPVRELYVREIEAMGARLRTVSDWLNAASFEMPPALAPQVFGLTYVYDMKPVTARTELAEPDFALARFQTGQSRSADTAELHRFYGPSYDQAQLMGVPEIFFRGFSGANVKLAIFDTGLKLKNRAVAKMHVYKQHDFLSGDNLQAARSDRNWAPSAIANLRYFGLVRDPALLTVGSQSGSRDTCLLAFVADSFAYGYNPPRRAVFASFTPDRGNTWADATPIVNSRPFDNTFENLAMAGHGFVSYLAYNDLTATSGAAPGTNVYLGWFIGTDWYGSPQWIGSGRYPSIALAGDTLYLAFVRAESALVLYKASVVMPAPEPLLTTIFNAGEAVTNPQVALGPDGTVDIVAATLRTGRVITFRSSDGGATFGPEREIVAAGARAARLIQNGAQLFLLYEDDSQTPFTKLTLKRSTDLGANWTQGKNVTDSTASIGSFTTEYDATAGLTAVYETDGLLSRAVSTDLGGTWTTSGPLDSAGFCYMPALCPTTNGQLAVWSKRGDDNTVWEDSDTLKFSREQPDHGTRMASIIAGWQQGGIVGIAPGVDLLVAKTELFKVKSGRYYEYNMEEDTYVEALEWAEAMGADVVSTSLGYRGWYGPDQFDGKTAPISVAASLAARRGMLVVTAMGNRDTTVYPWPMPYITAPGDAEGVITAGGVEKNFLPWRGTGTGPTSDGRVKPDLVALCDTVAVVSPDSEDYLDGSVGTSCATALIAGCCALLKEAHPQWSAESVKAVLFATATRSVKSCTLGFGVPRVDSAFRLFPPEKDVPDIPGDQIGGVFPNPFLPARHGMVYFQINLTRPASEARLRIYSSSGAIVFDTTLNSAVLTRPGRYGANGDVATIEAAGAVWNGTNQSGKPVASGLYAAVLQTTFGRHVAKFALVR
jgi:hypothetical protein